MAQVVNSIDSNVFFGINAKKTDESSSKLNMASFLRLLTTQLANQNPLEPMKDTDFYAQLAQLGTVQGMDELNATSQLTQANSLIGKEVTALRTGTTDVTSDSAYVTGIATGIVSRDGKRYLTLQEADGGTSEVEMGNIRSVKAVAGSNSVTDYVTLSNSAALIGKTITAPHPTMKTSDGVAETLSAEVTKVSFENGQVLLTVKDRLGNDVKVNLKNVVSFG
jgi:flagellar basal-body rod modification protein FlgD